MKLSLKSITPTNCRHLQQSLYMIHRTFFSRIGVKYQSYRPNINLVPTIPQVIVQYHRWIQQWNNGIQPKEYHPNQSPPRPTKFIYDSEYIIGTKYQVYWPNIKWVPAILQVIVQFHRWIQSNNGIQPKEYHPNQLTPPPTKFIYDSNYIHLKNWTLVSSSMLAQYQLGSNHSIGNCIVPQINLVK